MITVYGLANCDTCRKARQWLGKQGIAYRFHDVRSDGLDEPTIASWVREFGVAAILNTRGTTWRSLPAAERENLDESRAVQLMAAHPALIKRPVFDLGKSRLVGFSEATRKALVPA